MLHSHLLTSELDSKRGDFRKFAGAWGTELKRLSSLLVASSSQTSGAIKQAIKSCPHRVSFPSTEFDEQKSAVRPFLHSWSSHAEARRWADEILRHRTTFAADGSHYVPGREISVPLGVAQIAVFENSHAPSGDYRKEVHFRLVGPGEALSQDGILDIEATTSFKRFELEIVSACKFLRSKKGWRLRRERMPLVFFDGSLLISYSPERADVRFFQDYLRVSLELINESRECEVPVIGFIDQSYARDIVQMLDCLSGTTPANLAFDAQVMRAPAGGDGPPLRNWGDRSIFFHCARKGLTRDFLDSRGEPLVGFVYLQTTGKGLPARLDIPVWVFETGPLEEVLDTVRAECIAGTGYPYALEAADAAAVITARDREKLLATIREFAEREEFDLQVSPKAASKLRRR